MRAAYKERPRHSPSRPGAANAKATRSTGHQLDRPGRARRRRRHIRNARRSIAPSMHSVSGIWVSLNDTGQRYANSTFCREDGSGRNYVIPRGTPAAQAPLHPHRFFTTGWHLGAHPQQTDNVSGGVPLNRPTARPQHRYVPGRMVPLQHARTHRPTRPTCPSTSWPSSGLIEVTDPMPNPPTRRIQAGQREKTPVL